MFLGPPWTLAEESWCGREESNFHGISPTATSTLRVYQFRHDRKSSPGAGLGDIADKIMANKTKECSMSEPDWLVDLMPVAYLDAVATMEARVAAIAEG